MKTSLLLLLLVSPLASFAADPMPKCFDANKNEISVMNQAVIQYKTTLPNLQKVQVLVKATLVKMMPNVTNAFGTHMHFIISLSDDPSDPTGQIEIADSINGYTQASPADLSAGPFYLCGEYSTTNVNGTPKITTFTPSVTGAMIHWTHENDTNVSTPANGHPNGWIYANGKTFGLLASKSL